MLDKNLCEYLDHSSLRLCYCKSSRFFKSECPYETYREAMTCDIYNSNLHHKRKSIEKSVISKYATTKSR
ncbi:hypothetical protein ThvES_00020090 [Thiovulum sp. ES]|nr:hypothetical protein ThvES_00020090 [Thiovulum sp. ES]